MKLISTSSFRIYLLLPTCGKYVENALFFARSGNRLKMDTGFTYLKANEDSGDWLGLSLLGFGIGFYWNFTGENW